MSHDERLRHDFSRNPTLDLGGYDLNAFRKFFSVLVSICSVHEYGVRQRLPLWSRP
jgi:hypothetical protein